MMDSCWTPVGTVALSSSLVLESCRSVAVPLRTTPGKGFLIFLFARKVLKGQRVRCEDVVDAIPFGDAEVDV